MKYLLLWTLFSNAALAGIFGIPPNSTYKTYKDNLIEKKAGYAWLAFVPAPSDVFSEYTIECDRSGRFDTVYATSAKFDLRNKQNGLEASVRLLIRELNHAYGTPSETEDQFATKIMTSFANREGKEDLRISWFDNEKMENTDMSIITVYVSREYARATIALIARFKKD